MRIAANKQHSCQNIARYYHYLDKQILAPDLTSSKLYLANLSICLFTLEQQKQYYIQLVFTKAAMLQHQASSNIERAYQQCNKLL